MKTLTRDGKLPTRIKLFYGVGDVGNALVNSALQFFLMIFYTDAALLAPALWSAGDLLTGPQLARVRECANDKCLWLFLDESKNGTRRWCSMSACGNRAKAHRHYLRSKEK